MKSILNGKVYSKIYSNWELTWESDSNYRHWCYLKKLGTSYKDDILVVLFNPGSLSGNGDNLSRDTTLRNIRKVFDDLPYNCVVMNLFDFATPKPDVLIFNNWINKDKSNYSSIYDYLELFNIKAYILAYGDYENWSDADNQSIRKRIEHIRDKLNKYIAIPVIYNNSGTPKHDLVGCLMILSTK